MRLPHGPPVAKRREPELQSISTDEPGEQLACRIVRVVSELTGVPAQTLAPSTRIREDLKADSMQVMALMIALDAEFDVEFDISQIPDEEVTIEWIQTFVESSLARST